MKMSGLEKNIRKYFRDVTFPNGMADRTYSALIVVHSFAQGGSQVAIESVVPILHNECRSPKTDFGLSDGYSILIVSYEDGPYKRVYESHGAVCAIADDRPNEPGFREFLNSFDLVIINSFVSRFYLYYFINTVTPVIWWLHETGELLKKMNGHLLYHKGLSENIKICVPNAGLLTMVKKSWGGHKMRIIANSCER